MKKFFFLFLLSIVCVLFLGFYVAKAAFAIPPCNLSQVNINDQLRKSVQCQPSSDIGPIGLGRRVCDPEENPCGDESYVYCEAPYSPSPGFPFRETVCFKKGKTTEQPSCPSGKGQWDPGRQCCAVDTNCSGEGGTGVVCTGKECLSDDTPTCSRNSYLNRYDKDLKACVSPTGASTPWLLNYANCDGEPLSGIDTAIGCIRTDKLEETVNFILKWVLGISGGVILLLLIITGYNLLTSTGNPEKLQGVKENIVSIFSGLILIGFSLVLLKVIGADVLKLPGF